MSIAEHLKGVRIGLLRRNILQNKFANASNIGIEGIFHIRLGSKWGRTLHILVVLAFGQLVIASVCNIHEQLFD